MNEINTNPDSTKPTKGESSGSDSDDSSSDNSSSSSATEEEKENQSGKCKQAAACKDSVSSYYTFSDDDQCIVQVSNITNEKVHEVGT